LHILIYVLTRRRPLAAKVIPYTTLFRSPGERAMPGVGVGCPKPGRRAETELPSAAGEDTRIESSRGTWNRTERCMAVMSPSGWADRKSTRLNSSHRTNSYAVFCLKKKKY